MNATNRTALKLMVILYVAIVIITMSSKEGYNSGRTGYRYGFIDTNPSRRVSDAFDSSEGGNVYDGYPLP